MQTQWTVVDLVEAHIALNTKAEMMASLAADISEQIQGGLGG